ncbi:MAG: hypothetical protein PHH98_03600 [Candidatus Gracilibacteria bacterium]|nr:hypothetical protein [Candidatus Gracilibacteria bacterium]
MFETNILLSGIIFSSVGMGYFIYGKKTPNYIALISGIVLMIYPLLVTNIYYMIGIGVAFIVLPFLIRG